jgi:hypothetical protein
LVDRWGGKRESGGMARKIRLQCPGAIRHVIGRGDRRERVFMDDADPFYEKTGDSRK